MKHLCDNCKSSPSPIYDINGLHIKSFCSGCGGEVKFGRIMFIPSRSKTCLDILKTNIELYRIKELKELLCITPAIRLVKRDAVYFNLYILIKMENSCFECGKSGPVKITYAGPHLKASCGFCGKYIKFTPANTVPNFLESKNKIWCLTKDVDFIKDAKIKCGVHDDLKGVDQNIAYHNLYLYILKSQTK